MSNLNTTKSLLVTFGAVLALAACGNGADRVASPGEGAFPPPPTTPPPTTPPPTTPPPTGGPAADCPTGFNNIGTVANGTLRACQLPALVVGNLVVPKRDGTVYAISGKTQVGEDMGGNAQSPIAGARKGTLTIDAGVKLYGSAGADFLVVNRGSEIYAQGTSTAPVVFTSKQSVEGQTNVDSIGQWGGVVILGRAPISACPGETASGTPECQAQVEGTNAFYGGNSAHDNSGELKYVRVQHSGFEIAPNNELNGITLAGVGDGTSVNHVQVHNSSDDGIEIFGGTVNISRIVLTGNDDDSLDTDTGWNGAAQFVVIMQRANGGDRANEFSAIRRTPYSKPKIANFTYVGRGAGKEAIILNQGTQGTFVNGVVSASSTCLTIADDTTTGTFHSVRFSCETPFKDARAKTAFEAGTGNSTGATTLTGGFINGSAESTIAAYADIRSISPFFQQVDYVGAVKNGSDNWWQGWTCGLTAASGC